MSVYKPKGSETYVYDFQRGGRRFSGSTGAKSKREADQVERELKDAAKAERARDRARPSAAMTLDVACQRYWLEVGQHCKNARGVEWSLDYLLEHIGETTLLADIDDDRVSALFARRRGERVDNVMVRRKAARGKASARPGKLVSAATVNRSVTEPLRRIMLRARDRWKKDVGLIDWAQHKLKEPKERVRALSHDEEGKLFAALPAAYHPIVRFALRTGCRAMEGVNLRWSDVDWGDLRLTIAGKGGKVAAIPLPFDVRDVLFPLQRDGTEFVFRQPDGGRITYRAYYSAFLTATRRAGIKGLRIHDLRHTAATRMLRQTGNLKLARDLLRHEDISTTAKYAHTLDSDLRDALNAMPTHEVPGKVPETSAKSLQEKA